MMENNNENTAKIDMEVIEKMIEKNVLESLASEKEINRVMLNAYAEMLSELKHLEAAIQTLNSTIAICGNDKITDYFVKLHDNQARAEMEARMKPKKATKVRKTKRK